MKFHVGVVTKAKRLFIPYSPANLKNPDGGEFDLKRKQVDSGFVRRNSDFGNRDEAFFDSKGWFDSDAEDDFFSVNGDFTPSRGSTPNHQISHQVIPLNNGLFVSSIPDTKSETSSTDGKKKLAELLQETLQVEQDSDEKKAAKEETETNGEMDVQNPMPKPQLTETPNHCSGPLSIPRNELTPMSMNCRKERAKRNSQCCLPNFAHSLSFNERKKQMIPEGVSST